MSESKESERRIDPNDLDWTTPRQCDPGEVVLVHMCWTPMPEFGTEWFEPPAPPNDWLMGFWAPVPRVMAGIPDPHLEACSVFAEGVINLFQEDSNYCVITVMELEWRFPWEGQFMIAKVPNDL